MTEKIPYMITSDKLVITLDQQYHNISRDDIRFTKLKDAIRDKDADLVRQILKPVKVWRKPLNSTEFFEGSTLTELENGVVVDSNGEALPEDLTKRMAGMMQEGFDAMPLERFWNKLRENPSKQAKDRLWHFLAHQGHALTEEGNFIGYRGVSSELKDLRTGRFDNSPGSVCKMKREDCDENPNNTCSSGLHVGSHGYASSFGPVVVEVEVNPKNVVSVPTDYNGQKMRVCEFKVLNICKSRVDSEMYESHVDPTGFTSPFWCDEESDWAMADEDLDDVEIWMATFGDRYTDDSFLAVRIAEEISHLTPAEILDMMDEVRSRVAAHAAEEAKSQQTNSNCVCQRNSKGQFVTGNANQARDPKTGRFLKA